MAKGKGDDNDGGGKGFDKHNRDKLQEVQDRIGRLQKSQMKERAVTAQFGKYSLSRGEITVTHVGGPVSSRPGGGSVGLIVWDPGTDRDKAMEGDDDRTDGIFWGDKDPNDKVNRSDKDGSSGDWRFLAKFNRPEVLVTARQSRGSSPQ